MNDAMLQSPLKALTDFIKVLNKLQIDYLIVGSFASSLHGEFRTTNDIDFICSTSHKKLTGLKELLTVSFIVDPDMIDQSILSGQAFNIFHEETFTKIDVFTNLSTFERQQLSRAQSVHIDGIDTPVKIASAEDVILAKLVWYKKGNMISDRQWRDIIGVIKVQKERLDYNYLKSTSDLLEVRVLLDKALTSYSY